MKKIKALSLMASALIMAMGITACGEAPVAISDSAAPQSTAAPSTDTTAVSSAPASAPVVNGNLNEHTVEAIKKKGVITFATESQYAPMCFKNEKGEMIGLEPVLMQAIADDLGVKLEIQDMAFDNVIPSVQAGAVDVGMAGLSPTAKRKESVNMTDFYNHGGQAMIVLTKNVDVYATKDAIKGKNVAAQKGSLQQTIGEEQFPDVKLSLFPKVPQCAEELKADNVAAVLMDDVSASQYAKMNPGVISVAKIPVEVDKEASGTSAATMKDNKDLTDYINGVIKKLWDSGDLDKWYLDATTAAEKMGL
ncbi:MAG: transporter substrate-binding domain-containing protein [Oscillospiraceae bacterium]